MHKLGIVAVALIFAGCAATTPQPALPTAPATETKAVTDRLHGVAITDPYRWLEEQNTPETREWIKRQNAYTDQILGARTEATLFAPRLAQLMATDHVATPIVRNGRYFFTRRGTGQTRHSIYMREGEAGADQLIIDPAAIGSDRAVTVGIADVSRDGAILAYAVNRGNAEAVEIHFLDINARRPRGNPLPPGQYYGVDVHIEAPGVLFTRMTKNGIRLFYRDLLSQNERKLWGDGYFHDKILVSSLSEDDRYLLIHVHHGTEAKVTEIFVEDLSDNDPVLPVVTNLNARTLAHFAGNKLILQTDWNAPNSRLMITDIARPDRKNWREIVPEKKNTAMQEVMIAGDRIYVRYLEDMKPRIVGFDLDGKVQDEIPFDAAGSIGDMSGQWGSPVAFFRFSSFANAPAVYQYDVTRRERTLFAQADAQVKPDDFVIEQVSYPSKDGTRVPMFVFYKKGLQRNGANPTYLTGYGGFGQSQVPSFHPRAIAWAERGGVFAIANVRGGGELGTEWHTAGMLGRKQNTFDDFAAAAEFLIRERYTSPQHLGVAGTGNGGLLVAALATQRPDLVSAAIARYPLTDMLRYHQQLQGPFWVPEYGDPQTASDFQWLHAYSPYHHVTSGVKYPAMLFITADAEPRIAPLHARKMTAMMQAASPEKPVLLRNHVTAESLTAQVKNFAEEMGFLWWQLRQ